MAGLTLLRHTTPDVAPGTCYGRTDLALAESFEQEARAVLEGLERPSVLLCSPLRRCRALAERIGVHLSLEVCLSEHWIEMDFGDWEGRPWADLPRADLDAWAADFHHYRGHGGESVAQLAARIEAGLAQVPEGALIVTHAGVIKAACALRGVGDGWDTQVGFGGLLRL